MYWDDVVNFQNPGPLDLYGGQFESSPSNDLFYSPQRYPCAEHYILDSDSLRKNVIDNGLRVFFYSMCISECQGQVVSDQHKEKTIVVAFFINFL